jgi:hypothetical protein
MSDPDGFVLPPGYKANARVSILVMAVVGEVLQGEDAQNLSMLWIA